MVYYDYSRETLQEKFERLSKEEASQRTKHNATKIIDVCNMDSLSYKIAKRRLEEFLEKYPQFNI